MVAAAAEVVAALFCVVAVAFPARGQMRRKEKNNPKSSNYWLVWDVIAKKNCVFGRMFEKLPLGTAPHPPHACGAVRKSSRTTVNYLNFQLVVCARSSPQLVCIQ